MRKPLILAALLGLVAASAAAQEKGTWEIGAFGRFNDYDGSYEVSRQSANGFGAGGRLGYFLSRKWSLEADGSGNWTDVKGFFTGYQSTALTYYPFHLRLLYNQKLGGEDSRFSWFLGAGPGYNLYGKDIPGIPGFDGNDWAVGGITGFRLGLTDWLALRVDATLDYIPSPNNGEPAIVNQGNGIAASSPATSNTNLAAQAGFSIFPNACNKSRDGTTISPTSASTAPGGGTVGFSGSAIRCGGADQVVYTVSGPGSVDQNGRYTGSNTGTATQTATVTACGRKNRLCSTATVTIPPPVTLVGIELTPETATVDRNQAVNYTVTGRYSDGTTRALAGCPLTADGGGTVSGYAVSWSAPGAKNVRTTCQGQSDAATVTVRAPDPPRIPVITVRPLYEVDSFRIKRPADVDTLTKIAEVLKQFPTIMVVIDGHTDSDASIGYNDTLGMRRANSVKEFFRSRGVNVDAMTFLLRSYGECKPVAGNNTAAGRQENRRAEVYSFRSESELAAVSAVCPDTRRRPL